MRGKGQTDTKRMSDRRITPAYAGKSCGQGLQFFPNGDHPRLCGEKCFCWCILFCDVGSPPPMRGKVLHVIFLFESDRITPAYAGKRPERRMSVARIQDHPRLCGEKQMRSSSMCFSSGSPPPMRGKDFV